MKETPIIMQAESVRAILANDKTQTRRIVKTRHPVSLIGHKGEQDNPSAWGYFFDGPSHNGYMVLGREHNDDHDHGLVSIPCPYGAVADRLWVKEAVAIRSDVDPAIDLDKALNYLIYRADDDGDLSLEWHDYAPGWRSPLFMPRWASRLTLEIVEVRVQRLQEISENDARAEAYRKVHGATGPTIPGPPLTARAAFKERWDVINSRRRRREWLAVGDPEYTVDRPWRTIVDESACWAANPWVWALTFRRLP